MGEWFDARSYLDWNCEPALRPARDGSPHGDARICQNPLLVESDAADAEFPIGAASVKEQGTAGEIAIVSVVVRGSDGTGGAAWFWWRRNEALGNVLVADFGVAECVDCHGTAPQDFVFTRLDDAP